MTVRELNRDQLAELKINYLADLGNDLSYEDLVNIHDLVPDEEVFDAYNGVNFVPDDFSCSAGQYMEDSTLEDKLLALEAKVQFIEDNGYIPWVSPFPSSTEKDLVNWVARAKNALNMAANCAHLLRY